MAAKYITTFVCKNYEAAIRLEGIKMLGMKSVIA